MPERITVTTGTVSGTKAPAGPRVSRYIVTGQTQFGPIEPVVVYSLREYLSHFGSRSGGPAMYDAAEFFFNNQAGELVVARAYGPGKANATISLDSGKIVVTAKNPGAFYNSWTAGWSSNSLTIVKGSKTVVYTGSDVAALQSAASIDPDVTVTVTALPGSTVAQTALAGGTDDYSNVNWATVLEGIPGSFGPGAIAAPGVPAAAAALVAHAAANRRLALLSSNQTDTDAQVISSQAAIAAQHKQHGSYVNQWGRVPDGAGGFKIIDGVTYAATVRAKTINILGVGVSAINREAHGLVRGFAPLRSISTQTFTDLEAAGVITIRTLATGAGIDVWKTAEGVGGQSALAGAEFRDMVNAAADDCERALDAHIGKPASSVVLASAAGDIVGQLEKYKPYLYPEYDASGALVNPGYTVTVSNGSDPADNRISAVAGLRFSENVEFVDFLINTASAVQTI